MFDRFRDRRVHLIGLSSLEIADVAVYLDGANHADLIGQAELIGHDLCEPDALYEHFRAAHIGMPKQERMAHWEALDRIDMPRRLGSRYLEGIEDEDVLIVSQAWRLYPANQPLLEWQKRKMRFVTPVELYLEVLSTTDGVSIGVTGSNGKSTTCNMIMSILRADGRDCLLAGNYRYRGPILGQLGSIAPGSVLVVELSNHHLMAVEGGVDVAVVTNVTPNHLEEHAGFEDYTAVKRKIVERVNSPGTVILNSDDPVSSRFSGATSGDIHRFSLTDESVNAYLKGGMMMLDLGDRSEVLAPCDSLRVPGRHNLSNGLAAALATSAVGVTPAAIAAGLGEFTGSPGRLQHVRTVAGVGLYYDIESTTPESTINALDTFHDRSIHLIAGGDNKGLSYEELVGRAAEVGAQLYLLDGTATEALVEAARERGLVTNRVETVESAVQMAFANAEEGAVILLSPAARAFYNHHLRGKSSFTRLVKRLRSADRGRAIAKTDTPVVR